MTGSPCPICQCQWGDTDCVHIPGRGTTKDPYVPTLHPDPDPDNFVECAPGGLAVLLPPEIIDPPCVHAFSSIDQTIQGQNENHDAAEQILFFNDHRYDTDSMHDDLNDPSRITFKTPGVYTVTTNILWDKSTEGDRALYIRKNSAQYMAITSLGMMGVRVIGMNATVEDYFEAGEYVEVLVKQDGPADLQVLAQRYTPNFSAMYMRKAPP